MMKFLAISDLHTYLPTITEEFDLLMICGDVCPDEETKYQQGDYMKTTFANWVKSLPFKTPWSKVIFVPGNHDGFFDGYSGIGDKMIIEHNAGGRLVILNHDIYEFEYPVSDGIDSLTIFGSPYCKRFGNWPFMVDNETLEKKYSQIPDNVEILLTHDSPNIDKLGAVTDENSRFYNPFAGNDVLVKHIDRIKPIIFHSGHIHSGNHNFHQYNGIWMANVSYVDEDTLPINGYLSYNFDEETKKVIY